MARKRPRVVPGLSVIAEHMDISTEYYLAYPPIVARNTLTLPLNGEIMESLVTCSYCGAYHSPNAMSARADTIFRRLPTMKTAYISSSSDEISNVFMFRPLECLGDGHTGEEQTRKRPQQHSPPSRHRMIRWVGHQQTPSATPEQEAAVKAVRLFVLCNRTGYHAIWFR